MKYRYCKVIFAVLLLLVLCSCACRHEWMPSDCVNPQICASCNKTGSPSLGHDWVDATCTAPQTCTRCGITQGEPLAHSYGDWVFGAEEMTHSCTICGYEETSELDHGLYLDTVLPVTGICFPLICMAGSIPVLHFLALSMILPAIWFSVKTGPAESG